MKALNLLAQQQLKAAIVQAVKNLISNGRSLIINILHCGLIESITINEIKS